MNNTKHCFDGGDCNYHYAMNYREPCKDYECCYNSVPRPPIEDDCGTFYFISVSDSFLYLILRLLEQQIFTPQLWKTLCDQQIVIFGHKSIRVFIPCTAFEIANCIWTHFGQINTNHFQIKSVLNIKVTHIFWAIFVSISFALNMRMSCNL